MGNAGSMDQHPDFRGHNMPLKLPMPDPGELEERFASVLVSFNSVSISLFLLALLCSGDTDSCVWIGWSRCLTSTPALLLGEK